MCSQKYTIHFFFVLRTVFSDCCLTPIQQSSLPEIKTTLYATLALISSNYSLHMTENDWGGIRQNYRVYIHEFMCLFGYSKTRWVSYKKQKRLALAGRLASPQ